MGVRTPNGKGSPESPYTRYATGSGFGVACFCRTLYTTIRSNQPHICHRDCVGIEAIPEASCTKLTYLGKFQFYVNQLLISANERSTRAHRPAERMHGPAEGVALSARPVRP